jgi:hypothetical protein
MAKNPKRHVKAMTEAAFVVAENEIIFNTFDDI